MTDEPRHLAQLRARLRSHGQQTGRTPEALERLVGNVVVGELLPPGVIKGGTALKLRLGDVATRFSRDLDAARPAQAWTPVVVAYQDWDTIYAEAAAGLDVLPTVEEAIAWANDELIPRMEARRDGPGRE